ncbi:hypothetical protein [Actinomadura flavalba]|uniref:hypothetical protein n=1 Tax=Actinomadura flavalba TaxID=1120938 RepID=UPI0012DDFAC3|nr:hypothetical protein [Actinomadura flavalba]
MPIAATLALLVVLTGVLAVERLRERPPRLTERSGAMPAYLFVSLPADRSGPARLQIRATATGRVVDEVAAPTGSEYLDVAVTADNRTAFVVVQPRRATACTFGIERITLGIDGRIAARSALPGGPLMGVIREDGTLAVTPDGRRLVYSAARCVGGRPVDGGMTLGVLDTGGGTGSTRSFARGAARSFSWRADGRGFAFVWITGASPSTGRVEIRTFAVGEDGTIGAGRMIRRLRADSVLTLAALLPAGDRIVVSESKPAAAIAPPPGTGNAPARPPVATELSVIRAADGARVDTVRLPGGSAIAPSLLKLDASGRHLLTATGAYDLRTGRARPVGGGSTALDADW